MPEKWRKKKGTNEETKGTGAKWRNCGGRWAVRTQEGNEVTREDRGRRNEETKKERQLQGTQGYQVWCCNMILAALFVYFSLKLSASINNTCSSHCVLIINFHVKFCFQILPSLILDIMGLCHGWVVTCHPVTTTAQVQEFW
jgi:hypothetical protein